MRCATNGPKIGVQPVKSSRKPHKGNSSLVDVQGGPRGPTISQQKSLDLFFFLCLRQTAFLRATGETTAEIKHKKFVGYVEYRA
jgi:hypothetical protein